MREKKNGNLGQKVLRYERPVLASSTHPPGDKKTNQSKVVPVPGTRSVVQFSSFWKCTPSLGAKLVGSRGIMVLIGHICSLWYSTSPQI